MTLSAILFYPQPSDRTHPTVDKTKARFGDVASAIVPKCFQTMIGPSKLSFLARPSTDKSFQMTIRIYSYKNFMKHNHRI